MKKSKLFMISSFALAMVASLVMAFAMMNVTKAEPTTVSADTVTRVYFLNKMLPSTSSKWAAGDIRVYAYDSSNDEIKNAEWPGELMTTISETDWLYYELNTTKYDTIIFNNNTYENGKQTVSITVGDNRSFTVNGWKTGTPWSGDLSVAASTGTINENITVYFNSACKNWEEDVNFVAYKIHYFNDDFGIAGTSFPGVAMTQYESTDWYYYTYPTIYSTVIFDGGVNTLQTSNITVNASNPYYLNDGIWSNAMPDPSKYYVVGSKTSWVLNTANVMDDATDGSDRAQLKYSATANEQIRVIKGDGTWINKQGENFDIGVDITNMTEGDDANNIKLNSTAYYVIHVDDSEGNGKTWVTNYINLNAKVSTGKNFFLMVSEFNLSAYSSSASNIGFYYHNDCVGTGGDSVTDDYTTTKYYTSITLNGAGTISPSSEGNVFIVKEIGCKAGDTITAQAKIYNGSKVIATSDVKSHKVA